MSVLPNCLRNVLVDSDPNCITHGAYWQVEAWLPVMAQRWSQWPVSCGVGILDISVAPSPKAIHTLGPVLGFLSQFVSTPPTSQLGC